MSQRLLSGLATILLVVCAVTVTALTVRRELRPQRTSQNAPTPIGNWLDFANEGRRLGPIDAPVAIVEFADFQCPACRLFEQRIAKTRRRVGAPFVVVYRHLPLDIHPFAHAAAEASDCAAAQGRFEQMHGLLFRQQNSLGNVKWQTVAADAGVPDLKRFERCLNEHAATGTIQRDVEAANKLGITGTPTLLIAGVRINGVPPQQTLDSLVREALRNTR